MRLTDKSLQTLIKQKLGDSTDTFEALTWARQVFHWPTNSKPSHRLIALVQCNHYLVVLLYMKLSFELRSYHNAHTDNHYPTRYYPSGATHIAPTCSYQGLPGDFNFFLKYSRACHCDSNTDPAPLLVWITQCLGNL